MEENYLLKLTLTKYIYHFLQYKKAELNKMPLFIATHKWGKGDTLTVIKKVLLAKRPPELKLHTVHMTTDMTEGFSLWEAESSKQVEDFIRKEIPEMNTEVKQVIEWFPPGQGLYMVIYNIIK
ncbi:MAG: hypothetical protein DRJ38_10055 [Thermoprotei archaeon]|nr:MAG: hypothetical protein DRJ38_10055 [Thermoprotei archaeon]